MMKGKINVKRVISFVTVLCLAVSLNIYPAFATDNSSGCDANKEELINILNFIELQKVSFGLGSVDFDTLEIGGRIPAYEYINEDFQEIFGFYPLFSNSELVALALSTDGESFQIITALADEISKIGASQFAIIYDVTGCYLYDGSRLILLAGESLNGDDRSTLPEDATVFKDKILLANLRETKPLGYVSHVEKSSERRVYCNVDVVLQNYSNICWAACIACINNYLNGTTLTAREVAIKKAGSNVESVFNVGLKSSRAAEFMRETYGLRYDFRDGGLSESAIVGNLNNNYPIYALFSWQNNGGSHVVVINGIDIFGCYLYIMDPLYGLMGVTYTPGDKISFIAPYEGLTLTMTNAVSAQT